MMFTVSFGYSLFLLVLWRIEWGRTIKTGPDLLQLFLMLFAIEIIIPGALLTAMISLFGSSQKTGIYFFDLVQGDVGAVEAALVLVLSVLFVGALYVTWLAIDAVVGDNLIHRPRVRLEVSRRRLIFVMAIGLAGMWVLLQSLGGGVIGYRNLMLFRAGSSEIERTFVTANLFSLTQTFLILSVLGVFTFWVRNSRRDFLFALSCLIVFGLMCVSRRAFGIVALLAWFTFVVTRRKYYFFKFVLPATLVFVPIIMFGKEYIAFFSSSPDTVFDLAEANVATGLSGVRRVLSDIGFSIIESWATLLYLDIPFRFGVDHILSVARRIPDGMVGLDIDFPERIVRISTEAFLGKEEQDIPPGFVGQMWLDFGVFGPVIWGGCFGLQIKLLQIAYNNIKQTIEVTALFVIFLFIVALPINTGSFDFTFSVDILLLLLAIGFVTVRRRVA
jgi:hypothetical protein